MPEKTDPVADRNSREVKPIELNQISLPESLREPGRISARPIVVDTKKVDTRRFLSNQDIGRDKISMHKAQLVHAANLQRQLAESRSFCLQPAPVQG